MINETPITTITRITDAPLSCNHGPTAKRHLKNTPQTHRPQTRNNTPGAVPVITRIELVIQNVVYAHDPTDPILAASMTRPPNVPFTCNAQQKLISTQAINALTTREQCTPNAAFRHQGMGPDPHTLAANMNHYANPMMHLVTGNIVSSYKKAMNDTCIGDL